MKGPWTWPRLTLDFGRPGRLCGLSHPKRLELIAEGLPIVFESAKGFLSASESLAERCPRESEVLEGFAEEEAAKALILVDMVRCPRKIAPSLLGKMTRWFYDHLARLIYSDACHGKPMHVSQLQEYSNSQIQALC